MLKIHTTDKDILNLHCKLVPPQKNEGSDGAAAGFWTKAKNITKQMFLKLLTYLTYQKMANDVPGF